MDPGTNVVPNRKLRDTTPLCFCIVSAILALAAIGCSTTPDIYPPPIQRFVTPKPFKDVIEELDFAITERNFRITGRNTIGAGIKKRGYPDFPNVEVIHFCSLETAREVLELDPGFVAQMPCRITVHEEADQVVISLILLPEDHPNPRVNAFARKMNGLLYEIVEFALEKNAS